jgi:hypothetical protein
VLEADPSHSLDVMRRRILCPSTLERIANKEQIILAGPKQSGKVSESDQTAVAISQIIVKEFEEANVR